MPTNLTLKTLWPWLAALAILLFAWFVPLPAAVTSTDQFAAPRMPQTRAAVESARPIFLDAQRAYVDYVKSANLATLRTDLTVQLDILKEKGGDVSTAVALKSVTPYADTLQRYAAAGEAYYDALKKYDDDLMAWTRSLGPTSESLRPATFPIVEHLKRYPPPIGETPDPPYLSAAQVASQSAAFRADFHALQKVTSPQQGQQLASALSKDVDNIWSAGRSIEQIESLHEQYYGFLKTYDSTVQVTAANGDSTTNNPSPLALILDVLVGVLAFAGVGILFISGRRKSSQRALG